MKAVDFQCVRTEGGLVTLSGPSYNLGLNAEETREALRIAQKKLDELGLLKSSAQRTEITIQVILMEVTDGQAL